MSISSTLAPDAPRVDQPDAPAPTAATRARPRRDWVAIGTLGALLLATSVLYLWGLDASGYANSFYSAAAQAGSQNWTAWFFGSLDAGNAITVDKPPAALWIMGLSVRIFGLSSWSILVPEALMGVATVGVVYATVRRALAGGLGGRVQSPRFGHWAGLAAALITALTPVATLMFRFNNPDALLVLLLTLATYCTVRAAQAGSRRWLMLAGVAIGFGFLTKMLQAFVILPALVLAYAIGANVPWRRKIVDLLAAFAAVLVSAGWYVAIFELIPANLRPYMGGTQTNSFLELVLGYNGLGRILGTEVGSVGGGQNGPGVGLESILRMFTGVSGGMVSWLIPAALVLTVFAIVVLALRARRARSAASEGTPTPDAAGVRTAVAALAAFAGWLVITALVFSLMEGIYHDYYTVALAPAIGATVALAGAIVWAHRDRFVARLGLAVAALATGLWAFVLLRQAGGAYTVLGWVVEIVSIAAAVAMLYVDSFGRRTAAALLAVALGAGIAGPAAYSLNTAATPHSGSIVTAGPVSGMGGMGGPGRMGGDGMRGPRGNGGQPPAMPGTSTNTGTSSSTSTSTGSSSTAGGPGQGGGMGGLLNGASVSSEMTALLQANASDYTWAAAAIGSQNAASYQLASGEAVMAIGGFNGSDPAPTLAEFQQLVAQGKVHYFLGGELGGQQNGGSEAASEIATWVAENYTAQTVGNTTVYDLTQK